MYIYNEFKLQIMHIILLFSYIFKNSRFDSRNVGGFIYSDQFIQLSALLPTKYIYGLGEHRTSLMIDMNWKTYTFFNHDSPPTKDAS